MAKAKLQIGAHLKMEDPLAMAEATDSAVLQMFLSDPQGWKKPVADYEGGHAALREALAEAEIAAYVHAPYVINVASTNNRIRIPSRKLLNQTLQAAAEIGAAGVIVHGGHVTAEDDPGQGYENWYKAVQGAEIAVPMLVENTAGGSHAMARHTDAITGGPGAILHRDTAAPIPAGDFWEGVFGHVRVLGEKDLRFAIELAEELDVEVPLSRLALERLGPGLGLGQESGGDR